jgi:glutathione S-transferase
MKLYYHPVSTTCRPILMFAAENRVDLEYQLVDLFSGEQQHPAYLVVNASQQVPVLDDGDFRLTESSTILKYLADRCRTADYPTDLRERARVNERMDWFNTGFYRDFGYGFVYPQCLDTHRRPDAQFQSWNLEWAATGSRRWLEILDHHVIGPHNRYLCGERMTIADYFGAALLTVGEVIGDNYARLPNVQRWLDAVKARPSWDEANAAFYTHCVAPMQGTAFIRL